MENKPNKEESPIYDTDYAPKPTYKSPRLRGQATREERDRVEPGTGRPTTLVGRPVGPAPRPPPFATMSEYNSKAVPTRFPIQITPEPTLDPYIRRGRGSRIHYAPHGVSLPLSSLVSRIDQKQIRELQCKIRAQWIFGIIIILIVFQFFIYQCYYSLIQRLDLCSSSYVLSS